MPEPLIPPKRAIDDVIADNLAQAQAIGELASAASWGKPLDLGAGYDDTPLTLRMPMKVLKDAGVVPHEVSLMHALAALRAEVQSGTLEGDALTGAVQKLSEMQQDLSLRLERMRNAGTF